MALRDVLFSLKLNTKGFDKAAEGTRSKLKEIAGQRMAGISKELAGLQGDAVGNAKQIAKLSREFKHWEKVGKNAGTEVAKGMKDSARETQVAGRALAGLGGAGRMGLLKLVAGLTAAYGGVKALLGTVGQLKAGLVENAGLEQVQTFFTSVMGSADLAAGAVQALRREADATPFDTNAVIAAGKALAVESGGNKDRMMDLVKLAERLAVLNPEQGLEGAAFALKEALSGDFVSLQSRFNFGKAEVKALKAQGLKGADLVDKALSAKGIGQSAVDALGKTAAGRMSTLSSFASEIRRLLSGGIFKGISEAMGGAGGFIERHGQAIKDFAAGAGAWIAEMLPVAMGWIGQIFGRVTSGFRTAWGFLSGIVEWVRGLPALVGSMFQDGRLGAWFLTVVTTWIKILWDGAKLIGKLAWAGLVDGFPALVSSLVKILIDALRSALGERISGALGLNAVSEKLGQAASRNAEEGKDKAGAAFSEFGASAGAKLGALGSEFGRTTGLTDTLGRSMAQAQGGTGWVDQMTMRGAQGRRQEEARIAQAEAAAAWKRQMQGAAGPQKTPLDEKQKRALAKTAEGYNKTAGYKGRGRNNRVAVEVNWSSFDGNVSPLAVT